MDQADKQKKVKKIIYYSLLTLFAAVFLFCAIYIAHYYITGAQADDDWDDLASIKNNATAATEPTGTDPTGTPTEEPTGTEATEPQILPEYQELYAMNDDLVGWITIPDTNVNYPVMQTPDEPNFYLDKNFEKEYSRLGSLYVREVCDVFSPSDNVVIYGHYISSGASMFANLHKFKNKSFWEEHQTFTFDTLYEHHTYQIISVFKTSANVGEGYAYHRFNDAANEEEFKEFIDTIKKLDFYETGISAEYGDKLVTLSTCEYTLDNGRFVVVAKRIS